MIFIKNSWFYTSWIFLLLAAAEIQAVNKNKFIDLSYTFNNATNAWPGRKSTFNVEFEGYTQDGVWISSKGFCTSEHTSTHIDAPYHFQPKGRTLDEIPLEDFIDIPGVLIDIYDKVHVFKNGELSVIENYALKREDILDWESKNGQIPARSIVLLRTGWASRWNDKKAYLGEKNSVDTASDGKETDDPNKAPSIKLDLDVNFPGYSAEAAKFLTSERNILGVGIDTIGIDTGTNSRKIFPAHQIFTARNVYMIEMVANLHLLPPRDFNIWALPFKIDKGTGAPIRMVARVN